MYEFFCKLVVPPLPPFLLSYIHVPIHRTGKTCHWFSSCSSMILWRAAVLCNWLATPRNCADCSFTMKDAIQKMTNPDFIDVFDCLIQHLLMSPQLPQARRLKFHIIKSLYGWTWEKVLQPPPHPFFSACVFVLTICLISMLIQTSQTESILWRFSRVMLRLPLCSQGGKTTKRLNL